MMHVPDLPDALAHIRLQSCVGRGAQAQVWLGTDIRTGERVAVKITEIDTRDQRSLEMARQEALLLETIACPYVVRGLGAVIQEGKMFTVQEFIDGGTLRAFVTGHPGFFLAHPEAAKVVMKQLLIGLNTLHKKGIVWRDCKPDNILLATQVTPWPEFPFIPLVSDLGLVKQLADEYGATRMSAAASGTPLYMAPEQLQGSKIYTTQVDIWALGLVLHFMLTADDPFEVSDLTQNILERNLKKPFPHDDEQLAWLFDEMTQLRPNDRSDCGTLLAFEVIQELEVSTPKPRRVVVTTVLLSEIHKCGLWKPGRAAALELGVSLCNHVAALDGGACRLRDVSPGNILVDLVRRECQLVNMDPLDFKQLAGSPQQLAYLPLSAIEAAPLSPADLTWQVGCCILFVATRRSPYQDTNSFTTMSRIAQDNPDLGSPPEYPDICAGVLGLMRAKADLLQFAGKLDAQVARAGVWQPQDEQRDRQLQPREQELHEWKEKAAQSLYQLQKVQAENQQFKADLEALRREVNELKKKPELPKDSVARMTVPPCTCAAKSLNLIQAAAKGCASCCLKHIDQAGQVHDDWTALMTAANKGHVEAARVLLDREAKIQNKDGLTALMRAAYQGKAETVRLLLPHEATMQSNRGWTALMWAAQNGHLEAAQVLAPAEARQRRQDGFTALMIAAHQGRLKIVQLLIAFEKGQQNPAGETALLCAYKSGKKEAAVALWQTPEEKALLSQEQSQQVREALGLK